MKSFSESYEEPHSETQILPLFLISVFALTLAYFWNHLNLIDLQALIPIFAPLFFLICFLFFKTALVLLVLFMLFSPEIAIGSIGVRAVTLRVDDFMVPILVLGWLARIAVWRKFRLLSHSPLNLPVVLLLAVCLVSSVRGIQTGWAHPIPALFYNFKTVQFFAIFFLVLNYVRTERDVKFFLTFVLLTLVLVGIYTLFQVPSIEIFTERRITAPFEGRVEPGTIGGYMAFLLLIIFSLFLYESRPLKKGLYAVIGIVVVIPFIYTLNRTSYAALFGGLVFIAFIEYRENKKKWLIGSLLLLLLSSPLWLPRAVKERIAFTWEDSVNPGRTMGVDSSLQGRITTYEKMLNCVTTSPLLGCGVGSTDNPDSQYARTLFEIGPLGFGFWVWIFLRLFRISRWLFHSLGDGTLKGLVLGYRAGLVGILLHGFGSITLYTVRIMEPFWFITGLIVSLYLIKTSEDSTVTSANES